MRHATFNAIGMLSGMDEAEPAALDHFACSWTCQLGLGGHFTHGDALSLLRGLSVDMPDCPQCAVFVDMALELRR